MTIQTAHFGGRIEKLYINSVGEKVSNGQLLALIYSPELVTAQSELLTALSVKNTQPDLYLAVRNKLKLWKLSENQINKIETSKKLITNFPVYTNVSGIVTMKMVEQGNHVKEGAPLLKIANLNTVWAEFDAYEKQISAIKKGDEIIITTNANPSKSMISKVSFIDPILNTTTRTVTVRAQLNNKNGNLKPGMFVNGEIKTLNKSSKNDVITIPKTAVLWTGKRSVVYLKIHGEQPVFEMREVTLGNVVGDSYEILNGLLENDEIVVNGTFTVDAAAQLKGKKSMMNKAGGTVMTGHDHGGSQPTTSQPQKENITNTSISITDNGKKALLPLYEEYLVMKDALTQDKFGAAQKSGSSILKILENIDMSIFKGQSHDLWMKQSNIIKNALEHIMHYKKIEEIRNSFQQVSNAMISLTSSFKPFDKLLYVQHCPMADNNKGADWLSLSKEIKNPYFGNAMLSCGEVISTMQ
jgi:Cu(I)/Ag(I) efflux system membrane fusion protein